jgi:hypothetical protein
MGSLVFAKGLMLYLVLPNLAFFLLGREFFINRALINSDYLLLWIASCYLSSRTTRFLYAGLLGFDLFLSTESIYHFSDVATILSEHQLSGLNSVLFYSAAVGLLLLTIAALTIDRRREVLRPHLSKRGRVLVGIVVLSVAGATVARSFSPFDRDPEAFGDHVLVASGITETGLSSFRLAMNEQQTQSALPAPGAATAHLMRDLLLWGKSAGRDDIVLILVESQGLLKSAGDMRQVLAPLIDPAIQARYAVDTGAVYFFGTTMLAELRTLCRTYVQNTRRENLPSWDRCLPNVLRQLGYEAVSYHGFDRWFYERSNWYPAVGFERSYFADELKLLAPPRCGALFFHGVCDLWIADQVEHELSMPGRKFIYWLTLNSHLPVDSDLASESSFDCAGTETLREEIGPCELARIHFQLYARIARIALNSRLPATRFIIVGDHMPPFSKSSERALYDNERVPFVELTPRPVPQQRASPPGGSYRILPGGHDPG